ncbi:hypothetical protein Godav_009953 [Gossypium davidsonii]|uniref:Fe-S metabolism associated domain-containing protein n=1 Tax=Gossypium davidsonii TaxID=34287 RepID=A0A7J8SFF5_GOSDV|nr:hypothetical protein [Gossypium davidsonii]
MLAPFDESAWLPENRVNGCTTQVWLDAGIEKKGKVWFRADTEELVELNIGVHGKVQSRVKTWQNVLISMRDKTAALVAERHMK